MPNNISDKEIKLSREMNERLVEIMFHLAKTLTKEEKAKLLSLISESDSKRKIGKILICKRCIKEFEVPSELDEGEEHPDQCQECPSDS